MLRDYHCACNAGKNPPSRACTQAKNHCRFCKCKACGFCSVGAAGHGVAGAATQPRDSAGTHAAPAGEPRLGKPAAQPTTVRQSPGAAAGGARPVQIPSVLVLLLGLCLIGFLVWRRAREEQSEEAAHTLLGDVDQPYQSNGRRDIDEAILAAERLEEATRMGSERAEGGVYSRGGRALP